MPSSTKQAFVGAGANLGDRAATLDAAAERLRKHAEITALKSSSIYETDPVGVLDQPKFLNLAFGVETTLTPEGLLHFLLQVEQQFVRVRNERWGARTL